MKILSVEQQQIALESSQTANQLFSNLKRTPMYYLSGETNYELYRSINLQPKDSLIFEPLQVHFCNECDCSFDTDINSCTNADCMNCDIYDNPYDEENTWAFA